MTTPPRDAIEIVDRLMEELGELDLARLSQQVSELQGRTIRRKTADKLAERVPEILATQLIREHLNNRRDRRREPFRVMTVSELASLPKPEPIVRGLLYRDTLAQLSGGAGSFKSFMAVGIACAVASGRSSWEGYAVELDGPVVYVAAEGASGLHKRILAWCESNRVDPALLEDRLFVVPAAVQLGEAADVTEAAELALEHDAVLMVLDTRHRCTLGLEENSATDQGRAISGAETIIEDAGCTVWTLHHTAGRSGGSTPRGSTSWDGAVTSDLRITKVDKKDRTMTLHCEKHKDEADGCDHYFRLVPHTVSLELMPGCSEYDRATLVMVQGTEPTRGKAAPDDTERAATVAEVIEKMDQHGIPMDWGRDRAKAAVAEADSRFKARDTTWAEALRQRRQQEIDSAAKLTDDA